MVLAVPRYPGPVPFSASQETLLTKVGPSLLFPFPSFPEAQSLPIHGFGPHLTHFKWVMACGLGFAYL